MTFQTMLSVRFPIDLFILVGVAFAAGFGWTVGAWVCSRLLRP